MKIRPYVSIDIETSGISMDCEVLQIAAVFDDGVSPIENLETFDIKMYYKTFIAEPVAVQMNAKLISDMADSTKKREKTGEADYQFFAPSHAVGQVLSFLNKCQRQVQEFDKESKNSMDGRIIFAGKNAASFDIPRVRQFIEKYGTNKDLKQFDRITSYKVLDPGSMYYSDYGYNPSLSQINKSLGREAVTHNALDDAFDVVYAVRNKVQL